MEKLLLEAKENLTQLIKIIDNLTSPITTLAEEEAIARSKQTIQEIEKVVTALEFRP